MKVGIYGAPFSGKTTVFKLLVGTDVNDEIGVAKVRDERVDFLSKMFNPKKTTYATTELVDLPGLSPELSRKDKNQILMKIQNVDAVLWIIRAFEDESVPKYFDDASKEVQYLRDELLVRDLEIAESNVEKLKNAKRKLSTVEETQDLIDLGGVSKDGRVLKPSYEVKIGDILTIHMRDETFTIKIIDVPQKNEKGNYFEIYNKNDK
ncbi:MAG: 50S ribosome-binding GTPase [Thermotogae bacterium]|nr:50S ribosome-binding GTPase [Thermotogota bacterium]